MLREQLAEEKVCLYAARSLRGHTHAEILNQCSAKTLVHERIGNHNPAQVHDFALFPSIAEAAHDPFFRVNNEQVEVIRGDVLRVVGLQNQVIELPELHRCVPG